MKECDEIRKVLKLFKLSTNALDHIDDRIRMSEHALLVMQLDNQRLTKENLELTAKLAAPRSPSYGGIQTELRAAIHALEVVNAVTVQENKELREQNSNQGKLFVGIADALGMKLPALGQELDIGGLIPAVKSLKEAKSWAQYEPEIRTKERERIFRKLTSVRIGGIQRGFTIRQGVMIHELEFTEQALSDFLKEE